MRTLKTVGLGLQTVPQYSQYTYFFRTKYHLNKSKNNEWCQLMVLNRSCLSGKTVSAEWSNCRPLFSENIGNGSALSWMKRSSVEARLLIGILWNVFLFLWNGTNYNGGVIEDWDEFYLLKSVWVELLTQTSDIFWCDSWHMESTIEHAIQHVAPL